MSDELDKLLNTNNAPVSERRDIPAPKGWERGAEYQGNTGVGSTGAIDPAELEGLAEDEEAWMLRKAGYNPERWKIVGDHNYREWDANVGGGLIKTLQYRRFNVRLRGAEGAVGADIDYLMGLVDETPDSWALRYPHDPKGTTHVFATGDWQLGKIDGDGTEGSVARIKAGIEESAQILRTTYLNGEAKMCHIVFTADCGEYFVSQGGKNMWRTDLTVTEQHRLVRRLMLEAIRAHAPYCDRLTVVAIPGNHDQAIRTPGMTTYDDSFDVDALVAVTDLMEENPGAFGHVETFVPRRDSKFVTLDVNGTTIVHLHGEDIRPNKHFEWWQGQAFDRANEIGSADVMLMGHHHHFSVDTEGERTMVMVPSTESESTWWKNKKGTPGAPGSLVFYVKDGESWGYKIVGKRR